MSTHFKARKSTPWIIDGFSNSEESLYHVIQPTFQPITLRESQFVSVAIWQVQNVVIKYYKNHASC